MRLQRRAFFPLLASFAGMALSAGRSLASPPWWRWPFGGQEATPARGAASSAGLKFTTVRRTTLSNSTTTLNRDPDVFYIQGGSRRLELGRSFTKFGAAPKYGPRLVTIVRPDLGKTFQLNLDASEYTEAPYPPARPPRLTKEQMEERGMKTVPFPDNAKPTFRIKTDTKDTGERKDMFGYVARHVITTRKEIPLEGSSRGAQETITDAWYIDLEPQLRPTLFPQSLPLDESGRPRPVRSYGSATTLHPGEKSAMPPTETPEFVDVGEPETGFPVQEIRTSNSSYTRPDGSSRPSEVRTETTVTIEKGMFDPALFEVPSGFEQVDYIDRSPR
jgi:hypothetical protein